MLKYSDKDSVELRQTIRGEVEKVFERLGIPVQGFAVVFTLPEDDKSLAAHYVSTMPTKMTAKLFYQTAGDIYEQL